MLPTTNKVQVVPTQDDASTMLPTTNEVGGPTQNDAVDLEAGKTKDFEHVSSDPVEPYMILEDIA